MTALSDKDFRLASNGADFVFPDGVPLVWMLRLLGAGQAERVYGPDVMLAICELGTTNEHSHFFYGGNVGVPELLIEKLITRFPGIKIAGCHSPPFKPLSLSEDAEVVDKINRSGAQFLWVGLGAPNQEKWMAKHLGRIKVPVMLGVGAAFDFHAGTIRQASRCMQKAGLEWLFRLFMEPRRLWKRYLYNNPRFVYHAGKEVMLHHGKNLKKGSK